MYLSAYKYLEYIGGLKGKKRDSKGEKDALL